MKLATVDDALPDLERRLTDALSAALSDGECARLEFAARLAFALEAEIADLMTPAAGRLSPPRLVVAVAVGGVMKITPFWGSSQHPWGGCRSFSSRRGRGSCL